MDIEPNVVEFDFLLLVVNHARCQLPLAREVFAFVLEIASRKIVFSGVCLRIATEAL